MTKEEKEKLVAEVMEGFDFETALALEQLSVRGNCYKPSMEKFKKNAENLLKKTIDHDYRNFWWAGGLRGHGGLVACYDDNWGLSLNYIAVAKQVTTKPE